MTLLLWLSSDWSSIAVLGVFLTVFTLVFDFMKRRKKWSRYPPGPMSLPFVGTMPYIDFNNPHLSFNKVSASPAGWDVAVGMAGFSVSYSSLPTGVGLLQLRRSAHRICPSSSAQNVCSTPNQSQGLSFLEGKAQHSLQQITLQTLKAFFFFRTTLLSCLSKIHPMEKLNTAFVLFAFI